MTTTAPAGLLARYHVRPDGRDELLAGDGTIRPAWATLAAAFEELGPLELDHRADEVARLLRADGVTYNVYGDPAGPARPWVLDPIPFVIGSDEWAAIETGVAQRAELLDLVLADLYGPRDLIRKGLLPPEVVHAHPGFLRPADGVRLPVDQQLRSYAADLARDADGYAVVLGDLAQAPSGAGYALENRLVLSRVLPSLYRDAEVHRLAPFFRALRGSLTAAAPPGVDDPRVVVLTPGPFNETYFEHAYLASSLGYPLVEGGDLTVREGRVWLRSLGGLEQVHVILRRVDGWYCDPLELRPDSQLGVPGLVEAARRGTVSIVNPVGAAVLENAGLLPFLPDLAHKLLGEPLLLPQATTWWCGVDRDRAHVLAHLDRLVVKTLHRRPRGQHSVFGADLSVADREELARRIEARPHLFVGQEVLHPSTTPSLALTGIEPRAVVLRSFAVARDGSWSVMPGGLARVAPDADTAVVTNQTGALSKDVWVLASEPEGGGGFWLQSGPGVEATDPAALPSRAAENLFWLGRYAERAEDTVRLVRGVLDRRNEFEGGVTPAGTECLDGLLEALTHLTATYPGFVGPGGAERRQHPDDELVSLVADAERAGSLQHSLTALLTVANAVRDQLSVDTWLAVNDLERVLDPLHQPGPDPQAELQVALDDTMTSLLALAGLATESMVRDPGWAFMDAGRRIERALGLASLLRSALVPVRGTAAESLMLESVLVAAESIITYRRRYRSQAQVETLLDLLLLDDRNPRSVAFQLARLDDDVADLPRPDGHRLSAEERALVELSSHVRLADTARLAHPADGTGWRADLATFLDGLDAGLRRLSDALEASHFTHLQLQPLATVLEATPAGRPAERGPLDLS